MSFPYLETKRCFLQLAKAADAPALCQFLLHNQTHLAAWEPHPSPDYFTEAYWQARLAALEEEFSADRACCLHLFLKEGQQLIGSINYTHFIRGGFQSCFLGFKLDRDLQGQGLMTEALRCSIAYVFQHLGLHRIGANYLPQNKGSARVLEKCGFEVEGFAPEYLYIQGRWEAHILTSLRNPKWVPGKI